MAALVCKILKVVRGIKWIEIISKLRRITLRHTVSISPCSVAGIVTRYFLWSLPCYQINGRRLIRMKSWVMSRLSQRVNLQIHQQLWWSCHVCQLWPARWSSQHQNWMRWIEACDHSSRFAREYPAEFVPVPAMDLPIVLLPADSVCLKINLMLTRCLKYLHIKIRGMLAVTHLNSSPSVWSLGTFFRLWRAGHDHIWSYLLRMNGQCRWLRHHGYWTSFTTNLRSKNQIILWNTWRKTRWTPRTDADDKHLKRVSGMFLYIKTWFNQITINLITWQLLGIPYEMQ